MAYEPDPWTKARLKAKIAPIVKMVNDLDDKQAGLGKYSRVKYRCINCTREVIIPKPPLRTRIKCKKCNNIMVKV